jgi:hypothetical protein
MFLSLSKFIENWSNHPKRIHTTNNSFWKQHKMCFSSHLFAGPKNVIEEGCRLITLHAKKEIFQNIEISYPEQCFGVFFMLTLGKNVFHLDWKKVFYENIFITPCSELPGHLHSGQTLNLKESPTFQRTEKIMTNRQRLFIAILKNL